jgi:hypothetical protein
VDANASRELADATELAWLSQSSFGWVREFLDLPVDPLLTRSLVLRGNAALLGVGVAGSRRPGWCCGDAREGLLEEQNELLELGGRETAEVELSDGRGRWLLFRQA